MIAIFVSSNVCSPTKRRRGSGCPSTLAPEDEQAIYGVFDTLAEALPKRHRAELDEHLLSLGGIALVQSAAQSFSDCSNGTAAFFKGSYLDGDDITTAAEKLLSSYNEDPWDDEAEAEEPKALQKLGALKTPYAFIIHDAHRGVLFAARDPKGVERMFWGTNCEGDLLFCSDRSLLEKSCADADLFPAGALFVSEKNSTSGRIVDIPAAIPEEEEEEEESELDRVCRSISCSDLGGMGSRVASQNQIAAK